MTRRVLLTIDSREPGANTLPKFYERDFLKFNIANQCAVETKALEVGDYMLSIDNETILIIERKSIEDYHKSFSDGRLHEQKERLFSKYNRHSIMYLVEGDLLEGIQTMPKYGIACSMINAMLRDRIHVYHTSSLRESRQFILTLCRKCSKDTDMVLLWLKNPEFTTQLAAAAGDTGHAHAETESAGTSGTSGTSSYTRAVLDTMRMTKKSQLGMPKVSLQAMLETCYGVSANSSQVISSKYTSMKHFIADVTTASDEYNPTAQIQPQGKRKKTADSTDEDKYISYMFTHVFGPEANAKTAMRRPTFKLLLQSLGVYKELDESTSHESGAGSGAAATCE
jgi:ERCC4-type nuclease